jgi:hypothetical protein
MAGGTMNMEDTGFYRITYDRRHQEFRVEPKEFSVFGPRRNQVECVDSDLQIYSVHVLERNIVNGRELGKILLKNHVGEEWQS